jgi:3-carboxy-cis,cis-muconate cycloisomerase
VILSPGEGRAAGVAADAAVVSAMTRVEVAWLRARASDGGLDVAHPEALAAAVAEQTPDLAALGAATEDAGHAVVPLVAWLRTIVAPSTAAVVHRGLTSQDVVDTALVLVVRDALARVAGALRSTAATLGGLADQHRGTVMAGRTLTQHAVPITFGLKAARWLDGVLDGLAQVEASLAALPVQCGGAAGTLALTALEDDPVAVARAFAEELLLQWPGLPWHTRRTPFTRTGDALVTALDALGALAGDVTLLARPEIAELREGAVAGRGGSSTMPQKQNPVLSVLVRSAALQAPLLAAQLHVCAGQYADERPDGAWHAEWPALARLLTLAVTAASQASELVAGLEISAETMQRRVGDNADALLAESRGAVTDASAYLGANDAFIDAVLARLDQLDPGAIDA